MPAIIDRVMNRTPIHPSTLDYKYLKISLMLTSLDCLRTKNALVDSNQQMILWNLPKSTTSYLKVLFKEFISELRKELISCYESVAADDATLEAMLRATSEEGDNKNE